jgi:hypothetical protein
MLFQYVLVLLFLSSGFTYGQNDDEEPYVRPSASSNSHKKTLKHVTYDDDDVNTQNNSPSKTKGTLNSSLL